MREERVQGTGSRRGKEEKGKQKQNWGFSRIPQIHLKFVFLLCKDSVRRFASHVWRVLMLEEFSRIIEGVKVPNDIDRHGAGVAPLDYTLLLHTIEI
uniref:Uncharacterized protein n=2 Tax=Oryza glumipatula TaxID=40148 RepID=A0A0D9YRK1_9ORYZ